jgi:cell division protein FtsW
VIKAFYTKLKTFKARAGRPDLIFALIVLLLAAYGTAMVFSAGFYYAQARYGDEYYFIKRQGIWLLIGFVAMIAASTIDVKIYKKATPAVYVCTLALLITVLIFGFVGNGAQRWISIGPITIQPSEIAKIALILALARYFEDNAERALNLKSKRVMFIYGTLFPILIMLIPIVLVMLQKHLSCIIILGTIGLLMIVTSGAGLGFIYGFMAVGVSGVAALALFTDYTKERITVWLNPEAHKLTGGWQTLQGLMSIGSGGLFGLGYGNSLLKHLYVSEPANDMIFAILCEELGLIGGLSVIILFALLIFRGFNIAMRIEGIFSRMLVLGILIKMAIQVLLNVAVVTNSIPNTGISLPFFSYGGSSLIMLFFEMGIVLSISREARITK